MKKFVQLLNHYGNKQGGYFMKKWNFILKRFIDLFGGLFGLIIISPILFIIALLIKFTSNGPILFKQDRLGKDGKIFKILKFRTMVLNAEKIGDGLFVKNEADDRITIVGKYLRATSLDELPQLFNVIRGEMSLVGPRPPVPHHPHSYDDYTDFQRRRFSMKPGITGLAQLTVRNSVSWAERIPLDIEYVDTFNIWLDMKILFKTIMKILVRESIYTDSKNI